MQNLDVPKTTSAWFSLANTVVDLLDRLIDEVGEDESHPLASLMEIVGVLIQNYEDQPVPELIAN